MGEWNANTITCVTSGCGTNLGNTYGTPQIRRLHNGNWGVIFGNGFGSASGDAGIYVMSIDSTTAAKTIYYLSTNTAGGNGIAYVASTDLDGDHITDYVYAGDLQGNVWRFDLTNSDPTQWAASATPLFTTLSGQPITSQLLVISNNLVAGAPRLMIEFGTRQRTQITNAAPETFASGAQAIYAVWDWNMTAWNSLSASQYASLAGPFTLGPSNLLAQTFSINATTGVREESSALPVCWQGSSTCSSGNIKFGWSANLPGSGEQVIFNPVFFKGAFMVNSTVPANNALASCTNNQDSGYTYALAVANGGVFTNTFPTFTRNGVLITDSIASHVETNATGSVYIVTTAERTFEHRLSDDLRNPRRSEDQYPAKHEVQTIDLDRAPMKTLEKSRMPKQTTPPRGSSWRLLADRAHGHGGHPRHPRDHRHHVLYQPNPEVAAHGRAHGSAGFRRKEEKLFSTTNAYTATAAQLGYSTFTPVGNGYYNVTVAVDNTLAPPTYLITATPINVQASDTTCTTLFLDQTGAQGSSGSGTAATCWGH